MKKHWAFIKSAMYQSWIYKANIFGWMIGSLFYTVASLFLWYAIFSKIDGGTIVQQGVSFTFPLMLTYVLVSQVISFTVFSSNTFYQLGHDIRDGEIAINLTKPINYRSKLRDGCIGNFFGLSLFTTIPGLILIFLIVHFVLGICYPNWYNILYFLLSISLSVLLFDTFNFLFGQIAFFTGALFGLMLIKDTFLQFFSGTMISLSFLPQGLSDVLRILPFSSLVETPTYLLLNIYDTVPTLSFFGTVVSVPGPLIGLIKIGIQAIWLILLESLCYLSNRRIIRHVVSVGG
ncbi:MAG: ABC-2 family transporter protein [Bacilli bacterium]